MQKRYILASSALLLALSVSLSIKSFAAIQFGSAGKKEQLADKNYKGTYSMAIASMSTGSGKAYTPIKLVSHHQVGIVNPTDHVQTYTYTYMLCAEKQGCLTYPHTIAIQPGQRYDDNYTINATVAYGSVGQYKCWSETSIQGEYPDAMSAPNYIYVTY